MVYVASHNLKADWKLSLKLPEAIKTPIQFRPTSSISKLKLSYLETVESASPLLQRGTAKISFQTSTMSPSEAHTCSRPLY
jgi:hypothetical protein